MHRCIILVKNDNDILFIIALHKACHGMNSSCREYPIHSRLHTAIILALVIAKHNLVKQISVLLVQIRYHFRDAILHICII